MSYDWDSNLSHTQFTVSNASHDKIILKLNKTNNDIDNHTEIYIICLIFFFQNKNEWNWTVYREEVNQKKKKNIHYFMCCVYEATGMKN